MGTIDRLGNPIIALGNSGEAQQTQVADGARIAAEALLARNQEIQSALVKIRENTYIASTGDGTNILVAAQSNTVDYKSATVEPIAAGTIPKLSIEDLSAGMDSLQAEYNKTREGNDYKKIAEWLGKNIPKAEEIKTATAAHYDNMLTDCGNTILSKYTIAREDSIRQYNAGLVKGQEQAAGQIYKKYGDPAKDYADQDKYTKDVTATKFSEITVLDKLVNFNEVTDIGDINARTALAVKLEGMGQDELRQLSAEKASLKAKKLSTTAVDAKIKDVKDKQNAITNAKANLANRAAALKKERQQAIDKVINATDDKTNVEITIDGKKTTTTIKQAVEAREKAVAEVGKDNTNIAIKTEVAKLKEGKTETFTDSILKNALIDDGAKEAIQPFIEQINTITADKKSADGANGSLIGEMKGTKEKCLNHLKNPSSTPPSTSLEVWDKAVKAVGVLSDVFAMVKSFDPALNGGMGSMGLVDPRNFGLTLPQIPDVFKNTLGLPTGIDPSIAKQIADGAKSAQNPNATLFAASPFQTMGSFGIIGTPTSTGARGAGASASGTSASPLDAMLGYNAKVVTPIQNKK